MFCGQAFGAGNKKLAGIWLQVSYAVLAMLAFPVIALWCVTKFVMASAFDQGEPLSTDAGYYAMVLAACIPARIGYSQMTQFFGAQRKLLVSSFTNAVSPTHPDMHPYLPRRKSCWI